VLLLSDVGDRAASAAYSSSCSSCSSSSSSSGKRRPYISDDHDRLPASVYCL